MEGTAETLYSGPCGKKDSPSLASGGSWAHVPMEGVGRSQPSGGGSKCLRKLWGHVR